MTDTQKKNEIVVNAYSEFVNTFNIVKAHYLSRKSLLVWGSSGFGKSKSMEAFAKQLNLECFVLPMADKSAIDMFMMAVIGTKAVEIPVWWVRKLTEETDDQGNPYPDMMLFLDEITRAHSSMLPIIMEMANDHSIAGRKMRKNIFVVAASNFDSEDGGHQDLTLNQAGMRRFTHVTHKLNQRMLTEHSKGDMKSIINTMGPAYMFDFKQGEFFDNYEHSQLDCVRQHTDAFEIIEAGKDFLTQTEIRTILCGRTGLARGENLAQAYFSLQDKKSKKVIPEKLTYENFEEVFTLETTASRLEIVALLTMQFQEAVKNYKDSNKNVTYLDEMDVVVNYLHEKAEPETVGVVFGKIGFGDLADGGTLPVNLRDGSIVRANKKCLMFAFSNSQGNGKFSTTAGRKDKQAEASVNP
jgi:hypothetical protein